ncbi:hypothetical protein BpHYR1_005546 [Brachionus plicatilis]|uniref:Uncharacterized protein n=1 Tax=Brachionus plicatilis TaxID=10195 RepID=A0A3M7SH11_BRAPC|nr:hypothetical protein BpHYR1_005546 [Brachionus plicatilis]
MESTVNFLAFGFIRSKKAQKLIKLCQLKAGYYDLKTQDFKSIQSYKSDQQLRFLYLLTDQHCYQNPSVVVHIKDKMNIDHEI